MILLLTLLAAVPEAHAADFSGRIRRIRIRENQNDTSFRTIVQTESGDPDDVGELSVTVESLDSGETSTVTARVKSTRVLTTATLTGRVRPLEDIYNITATMRSVADPTLTTDWTVDLDRCESDCAWTEEVLDDGTVARARLSVVPQEDGTEDVTIDLRLVPGNTIEWYHEGVAVAGDDADKDGVSDESFDADLGGGPIFRTRWITKPWSTTDGAVQLDATLTNPDGTTDTFTDFVVLDLNGETGLVEATIKERRKGGYKVNLWTQATADAPVGSVYAEVSDTESEEVLAELDLDTPVETTTILVAALPSSLIEGEKVATTISLYAGDEELLSESLTIILAEGTLTTTFAEGGSVALHKAGIYVTEDGDYELAFSVIGADAELVDSAFVDISTRTTVGSVDAAVETLWQRWAGVVKTDEAPETFSFDAEVRDGDGVSVDGWSFDIQALFGTGTRSTTTQANNRAELL
jgi:hypothetical protein